MPYVDKQITCVDCGKVFVFSAKEQQKFIELGFRNDPKRCKPCRDKRKSARPETPPKVGNPYHEHFEAICHECGETARLPFRPRGDRPVYCSSCFETKRSESRNP